jgi:hypothetical protein
MNHVDSLSFTPRPDQDDSSREHLAAGGEQCREFDAHMQGAGGRAAAHGKVAGLKRMGERFGDSLTERQRVMLVVVGHSALCEAQTEGVQARERIEAFVDRS